MYFQINLPLKLLYVHDKHVKNNPIVLVMHETAEIDNAADLPGFSLDTLLHIVLIAFF